ncbi:MAG: metallophosphoesterase [Candidatus Eisenbacteria sp.]|nr:metallophosphoesterase [Candidatus Eisenbacteria bacterium]
MHCAGDRRVCIVVAIFFLLIGLSNSAAAGQVSAFEITSTGILLSGDSAAGQLHDFMLENDRVAVVISALGHAGHYSMSGGNILDAGSSTDRIDGLGELYTYFDDDWPRQAVYDWLEILDDGSSGGPAVIRVAGVDSDDFSLTVVTEYSLAADADHLTISTTITNTGAGTVSNFEMGDAFLWGACRKFAPGYGFGLSGTTTESWIAGTADVISYGYLSPGGDIWGPHGSSWSDVNVSTATLGPGDSATCTRNFVVGARDIASVATLIHEITGIPVGTVNCTVADQSSGLPIAGAEIDVYDDQGGMYLQIVAGAYGAGDTTLPTGNWCFRASAPSYLPEETWLLVQEGGVEYHNFLLTADAQTPTIGDTLTVIQRPLLNIPALVTVGDTLVIQCEGDPSTTGWAATLRRGEIEIPLEILGSAYDASTLWWDVPARIPSMPLHELYDLCVTADGGIVDCTRQAVRVLAEFRDDYYFIHLADTHLPTHMYNTEPGSEDDSSEVADLREVIADISIINPEFVLLTGDLVNEGEMEDYLDWHVYSRSQWLLTEFDAPVFLTSGNHDIGGWDSTPPPDGTARRDWWRFYGWKRLDDPPPGAPWYTQNYSFDYGPVHYIGLEAYDNYDGWRYNIYGGESFTSGQLQWLNDDLAAASGSAARVLFHHYDFQGQLDLGALGVNLALWGHIHRDQGSIYSQPCNLSTDNVCDGARSYRLIRVSNGSLQPTATISAGSSGQNLRVQYTPANDGTYYDVTAQVTNNHNMRFENGLVRFLMPGGGGSVVVTGGTLLQIDDSDSVDVYYVSVDIPASSTWTVTVTLDPTAVAAGADEVPICGLRLEQNHPNPFNPHTVLSYTLPEAGRTQVSVFDVLGREVAVLVEELQDAGRHSAQWDGRDRYGNPVAPGVYLARLSMGGKVRTRKIVLAR